MNLKFWTWFQRKPKIGLQPPVERFFNAVDELNEAWAEAPPGLRPWIVWQDRKVHDIQE